MIFPTIRTFDEFWSQVCHKPEFVVQDGPYGLKSVRYLFSDEQTFNSPLSRECRGIIFDAWGQIVARPFHKFFNVNEKPHTLESVIPWARILGALPKHDGTLIYFVPAHIEGKRLWIPTSQNGWRSPQIAAAGRLFFKNPVLHKILDKAGLGVTLLFEYVGPDNRVVVAYDREALYPVGAREIETGAYWDHAKVLDLFRSVGWPGETLHDLCPVHWAELKSAAIQQGRIDREGWILVQDDGERYKVKTAGYVSVHKALVRLTPERILEAWAEDRIDDVLAVLETSGRTDDAERVRGLAGMAAERLKSVVTEVDTVFKSSGSSERRNEMPDTYKQSPLLPLILERLGGGTPDYMSYAKRVIVPGILGEGSKDSAVLN